MITQWILDALKNAGISAKHLDCVDATKIIDEIVSKYVQPPTRHDPLWESFAMATAGRSNVGWKVICDFGEQEPILLYKDAESFEGFIFPSAKSLRDILFDTPAFEFYVTNRMTNFVLCHNHHDYLIGVGSCKQWLNSIDLQFD